MAAATSPGRASGSTTRRNAWSRVQPSTRAASSSDAGRLRKKPRRIHMQKGMANVVWASTSPMGVSIRPNRASATNIGTTRSTGGTT
jgi:hypothetical protein